MKKVLSVAMSPATKRGNYFCVELLRPGKWDYPEPGSPGFELGEKELAEIFDNYKAGIKGHELPVNLDHKEKTDCGWIKGLELSDNRLFAIIDVTKPEVRKDVEDGTLKFSSAELDFEYVCPERSAAGDDKPRIVLEAMALTNTPYIKKMDAVRPIVLSDRAAFAALNDTHFPGLAVRVEPGEEDNGEEDMTPEELKQLNARLSGLETQVKELSEKNRSLESENKALSAKLSEGEKAAEDVLRGARQTSFELALRNCKDWADKAVRKGRLTPAVASHYLRLCELAIFGGVAKVKLTERLPKPRKFRLAELDGEEAGEQDTLDMIEAVTEMLGQLPDKIAVDPNGANLSEEEDEDKKPSDDEEALVKAADDIQEADGKDDNGEYKMSRREALSRARTKLAERKRGGGR